MCYAVNDYMCKEDEKKKKRKRDDRDCDGQLTEVNGESESEVHNRVVYSRVAGTANLGHIRENPFSLTKGNFVVWFNIVLIFVAAIVTFRWLEDTESSGIACDRTKRAKIDEEEWSIHAFGYIACRNGCCKLHLISTEIKVKVSKLDKRAL